MLTDIARFFILQFSFLYSAIYYGFVEEIRYCKKWNLNVNWHTKWKLFSLPHLRFSEYYSTKSDSLRWMLYRRRRSAKWVIRSGRKPWWTSITWTPASSLPSTTTISRSPKCRPSHLAIIHLKCRALRSAEERQVQRVGLSRNQNGIVNWIAGKP